MDLVRCSTVRLHLITLMMSQARQSLLIAEVDYEWLPSRGRNAPSWTKMFHKLLRAFKREAHKVRGI